MAEKYELAEKDYMAGMKYKEIAEKYDVSINTVKSWKTRHKWSKDASEKGVHTKPKRVHTKKEIREPVVESDELTDKQLLFCMYYVRSLNATSAYKKVYECSYQTAMANSSRMLSNAKVKETVAELKRQRLESLDLDKYDVLEKYKAIAFADITDFIDFTQVESESTETNVEYNPDGSKKSEKTEVVPYTYTKFAMHRSDEIDGTLITEISKGKDGMFKVKLADKMKALEMLSKCTDLLNDNQLKQLKIEKEKAEVKQLTNETESSSRTIIVNDKEEMRRLMNERASR